MRKIILFFLLLSLPLALYSQTKVTAVVYESSHCKHCIALKEEFLPKIKEKYKDQLIWREVFIDDPAGLKELIAVNNYFGVEKGAKVPAILVGDKFLIGTNAITSQIDTAIQQAVETGISIKIEPEVNLVEVFNKIPLVVIIISGLIDGINPCAFAVIVFFVSFLAVYGYQRREIIFVGSTYCLAVFIAYFLIGLGLFQFLYTLSNISIVIKTFYYFVALFCFFLACLAFYDYYRYKKSGASKDQILQLPAVLKKRINLVIGSQLRQKQAKGPLSLMVNSFFVGFMVSLLEAVCTGQVYVPVIASITKYPELRVKAFSYLFLYNVMFIVPLFLIFVLSLLGFSSKIFNDFLRRHLGAIKLLLAFLFLGLAVFVVGYERIYDYLLPLFKNFVLRWVR